MSRTNTQICVSFGRDETELLDMLDRGRKEEHISRSSWFKNKIRETKDKAILMKEKTKENIKDSKEKLK